MIAPSCLQCDRPFPANSELASLPHGKRIAFDPERGRVWRICTKCGEWNLLGPDSTGSVVAELRSRLRVLTPGAIVHDVLGMVDVIVITAMPAALTTNPASVKHRRGLLRWSGYTGPIKFVVSAVLAVPQVMYLIEGSSWQTRPQIVSNWFAVITGFIAGQQLASIYRRQRPSSRQVIGAGISLAASFCVTIGAGDAWNGFGFLAVLGIVGFVTALASPATRVLRLADGTELQLTQESAAQIRVGYAPVATVAVADNLPGAGAITGTDVYRLIEHLLRRNQPQPTRDDIEQGWLIIRRCYDIEGVLVALGDIRPEDNRRHVFAELPMSWKMAFYFGIVEASGTESERDAIHDKIRDASEVAAIAESLDDRELAQGNH